MEQVKQSFTPIFRAKVKIFCDGQDLTYDQAVERVRELLGEAEELHLQSLCNMHDLAQLKTLLEFTLNKYVREA